MSGLDDNDDDKKKAKKIDELRKAFEKGKTPISKKEPTAKDLETDAAIAHRVDQDALKRTREKFGKGTAATSRDPHQEAIQREKEEAERLHITVEQLRMRKRQEASGSSSSSNSNNRQGSLSPQVARKDMGQGSSSSRTARKEPEKTDEEMAEELGMTLREYQRQKSVYAATVGKKEGSNKGETSPRASSPKTIQQQTYSPSASSQRLSSTGSSSPKTSRKETEKSDAELAAELGMTEREFQRQKSAFAARERDSSKKPKQ